ncbi:hypothetical protein CPB86DRAFT_715665 [Serendipita vermifera]|nr:hypothetical protein CPB86DRAFT_715665 [Serendipita vermifera]
MVLCSFALFSVLLRLSIFAYAQRITWTAEKKLQYREATRELWDHGYDSYMSYAFPTDELMPLSCFGRGPDFDNPRNWGTNDVAGNYSLTLVDVLDTLAIMGNQEEFSNAVQSVINWVQFDVNTKPQVFEVTIRVLGGLLSAHQLASEPSLGHQLTWYKGQLLDLAKDLAERLLPAFDTPTGLPYARINLRKGLEENESTETCVAGAGSLILEFATLSRLTGDERFEKAAYKAFFALWNRRSDLGLLGNNIDVLTGKWGGMGTTGIGAGVDSFYEYALKWYVMSGEPEFLDVWNEAYASIMSHARSVDGYSYRIIGMHSGLSVSSNVDSLSAFWPGLQVLAGDIQGAIKSHLFYWNLWRKYNAIPELFDAATHSLVVKTYPLRPEFIESTFFLYQATKDTFYLDVGAQILEDLQRRARVECGLATIEDILEDRLEDRMESFVLSETLKYLYLLFDENNPLATSDSNIVFTTEGHILTLNSTHIRPMSPTRRSSRQYENLTCPAIEEPAIYPGGLRPPPLSHGIRSRVDYDFARTLTGLPRDGDAAKQDAFWSTPYGTCEKPKVELFSYEFLLNRSGFQSKEDTEVASLKKKLVPWRGGVLVMETMGLRVAVRSRFDGRGYDITKIGHLQVRQGEKVFFNDTLLFGVDAAEAPTSQTRAPSIPLNFRTIRPSNPTVYDTVEKPEDLVQVTSEFIVEASTAEFGIDIDKARWISPEETSTTSFGLAGADLIRIPENPLGCSPYDQRLHNVTNKMIYVERGECLFIEKLAHARKAGAMGVIVWHEAEDPIRPTAESDDLRTYGKDIEGGVLLVVPGSAHSIIANRLSLAEQDPANNILTVKLEKEWPDELVESRVSLKPEPSRTKPTPGRILYINGHAMINTEIMF